MYRIVENDKSWHVVNNGPRRWDPTHEGRQDCAGRYPAVSRACWSTKVSTFQKVAVYFCMLTRTTTWVAGVSMLDGTTGSLIAVACRAAASSPACKQSMRTDYGHGSLHPVHPSCCQVDSHLRSEPVSHCQALQLGACAIAHLITCLIRRLNFVADQRSREDGSLNCLRRGSWLLPPLSRPLQ